MLSTFPALDISAVRGNNPGRTLLQEAFEKVCTHVLCRVMQCDDAIQTQGNLELVDALYQKFDDLACSAGMFLCHVRMDAVFCIHLCPLFSTAFS